MYTRARYTHAFLQPLRGLVAGCCRWAAQAATGITTMVWLDRDSVGTP